MTRHAVQAELAEFDPEAAAAIDATAPAQPQAEPGPGTPPPEDREFEVWLPVSCMGFRPPAILDKCMNIYGGMPLQPSL